MSIPERLKFVLDHRPLRLTRLSGHDVLQHKLDLHQTGVVGTNLSEYEQRFVEAFQWQAKNPSRQ